MLAVVACQAGDGWWAFLGSHPFNRSADAIKEREHVALIFTQAIPQNFSAMFVRFGCDLFSNASRRHNGTMALASLVL